MQRDPLTAKVIGCAIEVHRILGAGLLESTYEQCLAESSVCLSAAGAVASGVQRRPAECGYRIDVLVEQQLILELKAVDEIKGIHAAQLLTYLNAHSNGSIDQLQRQGIEGRH